MGVSVEEVKGLKSELYRFCKKFEGCFKTNRSRKHLKTYMNGQLSQLDRKSVEPIALEAGTPPRTLQEFLEIHKWDEGKAATRLRKVVQRKYRDENAIGVIDETSFAKKGKKTAGVQRQHCGSTGKVDNCVVTVHLGFVSGDFHTLVDGDLFLPKETWGQDRERCREAKIPDTVGYRPKWKIALELLERTLSDGVKMRWLTADEYYGQTKEFRNRVASMGLTYVVEIPVNLVGWTKEPKLERAGTVVKSGQTLKKDRLAPGAKKASPAPELWKRGGPSWQLWKIKETDKGLSVWQVRETAFYPNDSGIPGEKLRLIIAREVRTGEVKYFLSNADENVPLKELLFVAFSRWRIERIFEDGKGEIGFDHFEVRHYQPLMRHLILSMLSLFFLMDQTKRLREKKLQVDAPTNSSSHRNTTGSRAIAA